MLSDCHVHQCGQRKVIQNGSPSGSQTELVSTLSTDSTKDDMVNVRIER